MAFINDILNRNSTRSDKPWIHVRAILIAREWMGLAFLTAVRPWAFPAGPRQYSLAGSVGL